MINCVMRRLPVESAILSASGALICVCRLMSHSAVCTLFPRHAYSSASAIGDAVFKSSAASSM